LSKPASQSAPAAHSASDRLSGPEIFFLLAIWLAFTVLNYYLPRNNAYLLYGDGVDFAGCSWKMFNALCVYNFPDFFWSHTPLYPPLVMQVSALQSFFFLPDSFNFTLTQFPFWGILIFSLYLLGKRLFSALTGYLGVFFFLTLPLTIEWTYKYCLDIAAAAMVALSFYLLLRSDNFRHRGYSLWFGVSFALALLTKTLAAYLLLPVLAVMFLEKYFSFLKNNRLRLLGLLFFGGMWYLVIKIAYRLGDWDRKGQSAFWLFLLLTVLEGLAFYGGFRQFFKWAKKAGFADPERYSDMLNLLMALSLSYILSAWFYLNPDFCILSREVFVCGGGGWEGHPWPFLDFYPRMLWENGLRAGYLPFLLIGLTVFVITAWKKPEQRFLLLTLVLSALMLLLLPIKAERYPLPWLALASPVAVFWIEYLKELKILPLAALLFIGLIYAFCSWPPVINAFKDNARWFDFLIQGNPPLDGISQEVPLTGEQLRPFLAPLPKRGEKVLLFIHPEFSPGNMRILAPVFFSHLQLDFSEQPEMADYQYVIYSREAKETEREVRNKMTVRLTWLKGQPGCRWQNLSVLPVPQSGYRLFLARVLPLRAK